MVIGEDQFNPMSKEIAHDCNYTKPSTNTCHGARPADISAVGNAGVGPSNIKQFTRHSKIEQSTTYHECDEADRMRIAIVVQGLDVNDALNVADNANYNYVDADDDDQPTQR